MRIHCRSLIFLPILTATLPLRAEIDAASRDFFESKIRPILAQDCYECHSAALKKKGGLLLDSRAGWQAGGDTGAAIIPGDPAKSLLMEAIRHEHDDLKMPKAGAKLSDKVIADFARWISMGAPDPRDHPPSKEEVAKETDWRNILQRRKSESWAFQPIGNPSPPIAVGGKESAHPVDRFILAKLNDAGLQPSNRASAATIIRRLSFIITGLPPTPDEVAAFEQSSLRSPQSAIESAADRMLASSRFGETWARHWMDWVRYAESYGSEGDPPIPYAWRYRDYIIRALNDDVRYPQLVREAIAGDLLKHPRINREAGIDESALGIAQLRMVQHGFSPTDSLDEMVNFTDNQIDVVSKAFQGLTLSCARCHNHKFDPISQTDFYSWFGIFSSTHPAVIDVNLKSLGQLQRGKLLTLKQQIRDAVGRSWLKAAALLPKLETGPEAKAGNVMKHWDLGKDKWFTDGAGVAQGASKAGEFSVAPDGDKVIARIHPAGVFSDLVSTRERGVLMSPTFKNEGGTLWVRGAGGGGARARYIVDNYPRTGTIHKAKDFKEGDESLKWHKLDLEYWKGDDIFIQATTASDRPAEFVADARSWFGITDVVIAKGDQPPPEPRVAGDPLAAVKAWIEGSATNEQAELLDRLLRAGKLPNEAKQIPEAASPVAQYREIEARLPLPTRAAGVIEGDSHDAALFIRGDHKQPSDLVPRHFLDAIDGKPFHPADSGRLQLAESIVNPDNPLTSRVIVNRIWHHVFGRGIVSTTDNFGKLGEPPTHPELLDYLARRFSEGGGSIKEMIRFLVTTQTFQRDDRAPGGALEKDPDNKLLSHFPVRRVDAEAIRDEMLAVSGLLDETMYGESVGGGAPRRSVYVKVIRNNLDSLLTIFDAPVPTSTRGRRDATNVPAQSLSLLNDPNVNKWAESWSRRVLADGALKDDPARVRHMFEQAFGRTPTDAELAGSISFIKEVSGSGDASRKVLADAESAVRSLQQETDSILAPARERLEAKTKSAADAARLAAKSAPEPYAEWDFKHGAEDMRGRLKLSLQGDARVENGALMLDGGGSFAKSAPLPKTLRAKTMEAWVMLGNLEQRGGGVMTLQDDRGNVFDSIVFAEKEAGCWVPGSDFFRRSKNLEAPREEEAARRIVHMTAVYEADGMVTVYRDGKVLGRPYKSEGPAEFEAGKSQVLFGLRHGTSAGGNKVLTGRIYRARLYDRALSAAEVVATDKLESIGITDADVIASLTKPDQERLAAVRKNLDASNEKLANLRSQEIATGPESAWKEFAQSLFNLKEFIYLR